MVTQSRSVALSALLSPADAETRRAAIAEALAGPRLSTHYVRAQAGYLELPVVSIGHDALVYRADNGRILSELASHCRQAGLSVADFKAHFAEPAMQRVLHDLLIEKARDKEGPIYAEFEENRQQTEPLLVTRDGFVINGNRRLASMRALLAQAAARYASFSRIQAAVLPPELDREAIEYIEAALQMAPELKLAYGWINRRLKLREHARDLPQEVIARAYRFTDFGQIDAELGELSLAEQYLAFVGFPLDYAQIADAEEAFVGLFAQLAAIPQPWLRELWTFAGFAMLKVRAAMAKQILHCFPFTDPVPGEARDWVMRAFAEDKGLVERQPLEENRPVDAPLAARVLPLLSSPATSAEIAQHIVSLEDTLAVRHDKILGPFRAIANLRAARDNLVALSARDLPALHVRQLRAEVASIAYIIDSLEAALEGLAGSATPAEPATLPKPLILPHAAWEAAAGDGKAATVLDLIDILRLKPYAFRDRLGHIHIPAGEAGHAVYGPYLKPFAGAYRATVVVSVSTVSLLSRILSRSVTIDVVVDADTVLASHVAHVRSGRRERLTTLDFCVPAAVAANARTGLEIRVATDGRLSCIVEACKLERIADGPAPLRETH